MSTEFEKYLDDLDVQLQIARIPTQVRTDLIENLRDQFYEAYDKLVQQGISSEEGIREVLEAQEPIPEVVQRVKNEMINEPEFQEIDVKRIINTTSVLRKKMWYFLTVKKIQTHEWYKSNQSPLLRGFTYLGVFFVYMLGMAYLGYILPLLILYQTHPDKERKNIS